MSSNAITITGSTYTVKGTVKDQLTNKGIIDLHVLAYDKDSGEDDFLGIGVTDTNGAFSICFDTSKFTYLSFGSPDLYFIVKDAGTELLNTKTKVIENANESTPPINLRVGMRNDKLRKLINDTPAPGWVGGFLKDHPELDYPPQGPNQDIPPDLSTLDTNKNRTNIRKLDRQQKVLWPEFSWNSEPDNKGDKKRCYQMFAPDISRLGYTKEGKIYSIICPQQGLYIKGLGTINVEVTVTGNKGWVDEDNRTLAGSLSVEGRLWFTRETLKKQDHINLIMMRFLERGMPFPSEKKHAIVVRTHMPGDKSQALFPLTKGLTPPSTFKIPDFAMHEGIAWSKGHLGVQIGGIIPTKFAAVNKFNQLVLDIFNMGAGNMLKKGNILTWNVWFTAPEIVNQQEWKDHTDEWRDSIDVNHVSPDGEGSVARYYDGTPFKPLRELLRHELPKIIAFILEHLPHKQEKGVA